MGVHYIGEVQDASSPVRVAFDHITDGALRWSPMPDVYDRFDIGGRAFEFPSGAERLESQLIGYFPGEAAAIHRYIGAVNSTRKASGSTSRRRRPTAAGECDWRTDASAFPPQGGASQILDGIRPVIERSGGCVVVGAEVAHVLIEGGRAMGVTMADGREFRAKAVISDVGARNTFERLVPGAHSMKDVLQCLPRSMAHGVLGRRPSR